MLMFCLWSIPILKFCFFLLFFLTLCFLKSSYVSFFLSLNYFCNFQNYEAICQQPLYINYFLVTHLFEKSFYPVNFTKQIIFPRKYLLLTILCTIFMQQLLQPYQIKIQMKRKQQRYNTAAHTQYFGTDTGKKQHKAQGNLNNKRPSIIYSRSISKQKTLSNLKIKIKAASLKVQPFSQHRKKTVVYSKHTKNTQQTQLNSQTKNIQGRHIAQKTSFKNQNASLTKDNSNLRHCNSQHSLYSKSGKKTKKGYNKKLFFSGTNQKSNQNINLFKSVIQHPSETQQMGSSSKQNLNLKLDFSFLQNFSQHSFEDIEKMKLELFGFVLKHRIIKDQQFQKMYKRLLSQFPNFEQQIKAIMVDILTTLDV